MCEIGSFENSVFYSEMTDDGQVFKSLNAFNSKEGICYIPSLTFEEYGPSISLDNIEDNSYIAYSYQDFLDMCLGNEESAKILFDMVTWRYLETEIEGLTEIDYDICGACGTIYDLQEFSYCPSCSQKHKEIDNVSLLNSLDIGDDILISYPNSISKASTLLEKGDDYYKFRDKDGQFIFSKKYLTQNKDIKIKKIFTD